MHFFLFARDILARDIQRKHKILPSQYVVWDPGHYSPENPKRLLRNGEPPAGHNKIEKFVVRFQNQANFKFYKRETAKQKNTTNKPHTHFLFAQ